MLLHAKHITLWLLFALMCTSCSGVHDIREARSTVATADSLRAAGGALYNDSTALAFAVTTLEPVRLLFPTDYAHANYYYGRLLREAGGHPEAMLAFLRAVHSRTKDHVIKGRSWSNIANMCRQAANHTLAYDIYEKSAKEFILGNDSLNYFYVTNGKAYELAEGKHCSEAIAITNEIERHTTYEAILTKIWETRADAYVQAQKYDSAIYCVRQLHQRGYDEPTGLVLLSQAYYYLGIKDSALYYANRVLQCSSFYGDRFNALYIIIHNDSTINKDEVKRLNSVRTDIQMEHTEVLADLSQAILLLKQDLERKPDLTWLWAILATILIIGTPGIIYTSRKRSQNLLYSQQAAQAQEAHRILSEQNMQLEQLLTLRQEKAMKEMEEFCHSITTDNIHKTLSWKNFDQMCNIVNQRMFGLVDKLKSRGITSEPELRLCVLVAVGRFNNKEMVSLVPYGYDSLKTTKSGIANRLGVSGRKMREFLLHLAL